MSPEAGPRLDIFEILAPLGKGGMGKVCRAKRRDVRIPGGNRA